MDVLTKTYPTIPLSGHSELVSRYLQSCAEHLWQETNMKKSLICQSIKACEGMMWRYIFKSFKPLEISVDDFLNIKSVHYGNN